MFLFYGKIGHDGSNWPSRVFLQANALQSAAELQPNLISSRDQFTDLYKCSLDRSMLIATSILKLDKWEKQTEASHFIGII